MDSGTDNAVLHGFSIDVEDWFHIIDCDGAPSTDNWSLQEDRVVASTGRFLDLLDRHGHKATFFVLGWIAERHPELVAQIAERGHELGSHSYAHGMVQAQSHDEFARDLDRSLEAIKSACGQDVCAYRAPGFSIGNQQSWAFSVLASRGISLDASLFLAPRAHGGYSLRRERPFEIVLPEGKRLLEVPVIPWVPVRAVDALALPYSGGGYLRLLPSQALHRLYSHAQAQGLPVVTYMHPRELDPGQPRMRLPPWRAFKYYVGLASVHDKLDALMAQFRFGTLREVAASVELDDQYVLPEVA